MNFPNTLRKHRERRGMTQEDVCRKLEDFGVKLSIRQYCRYETGAQEPRLSMARYLAASLSHFNCLEIWSSPWDK